jgi:hypothetical protein
MGEWLKPAVLKTVDGETRPGVRIPLPPPDYSAWVAVELVEPGEFAVKISSPVTFTCAIGRNAGMRLRSTKHPKGLQARLVFGCGCPIYAKLPIRHPDPAIPRWSSTVRSRNSEYGKSRFAGELIDPWTVQFF